MRILFIKIYDTTFIRKDEEILRRHFKLDSIRFRYPNRFLLPIKLIQLFLWLVLHGRKYDVIFYYFIDFHSLPITVFGKLFGVKTAVVIGGYDAVYIPELRYGVYNNPIRGAIARFALKHTDLLLPDDDSLIYKKETFSDEVHILQGIANFVKEPNGKIETIRGGFDIPAIPDNALNKKENLIITVGFINSEKNYYIKGIDSFIETAELMPDTRFAIVNGDAELIARLHKKHLPENLDILPFLPREKLNELFLKAKIYCQLSLTEGTPNALCEAMSYGCIPVGSSAGGIPNVIGDTGVIVEKKDARLIREAILQAMKLEPRRPIKRIKDRYSIGEREKRLIKVINALTSSKRRRKKWQIR